MRHNISENIDGASLGVICGAMMFAFRDNPWTQWNGGPRPHMGGEQRAVPPLWSDAEKRVRFGLYRVTIDPTPAGKVIVSSALVDRDGLPALEHTFEDSAGQVPERVTSRQFKLQLEIAGLTETVEGWIAEQSRLIQIAYAASGTFVRNEPMMALGFQSLGFSTQDVDDFFTAAGAL